MSCWALIPIKTLSLGKGRLANVLSPAERQRLIRGMLAKVIAALAASPQIQGIAVVTSEALAPARKVTLLPDRGAGLNGSIADAVSTLSARGATELLVLHGDLPLLSTAEVNQMIASGRRSGLAIAPDRCHQGTNAIFLKSGAGFEFHFGPASFQRHLAEAVRCKLPSTIVDLPGLAFDVDEPPDLDLLTDRHELIREPSRGRVHAGANPTFLITSRSRPLWPTVQTDYSPMHARD